MDITTIRIKITGGCEKHYALSTKINIDWDNVDFVNSTVVKPIKSYKNENKP